MTPAQRDSPQFNDPGRVRGKELAGVGIGFGLMLGAEVLMLLGAVTGRLDHDPAVVWGPLLVMALAAGVIVTALAVAGKNNLALGIAAGYFLITPLVFTEWTLGARLFSMSRFPVMEQFKELHGTVSDPAGKPVAGAPLWVDPQNKQPPFLIRSGPDGRFAAVIPKGTTQYELTPLGFTGPGGDTYEPVTEGDRDGYHITNSGSYGPPSRGNFPGGNFNPAAVGGIPVRIMRSAGVRRMIDFTRPIQGDEQGDARFGLRIAEGVLQPGDCRDCDLTIRIAGCSVSCPMGNNPLSNQNPWSVVVSAGPGGGVLAQTADNTTGTHAVPEQGFAANASLTQTGCNDFHDYSQDNSYSTAARNLFFFRTATNPIYGRLEFTLRCPATYPGVTQYELGELRVLANPRGDPDLKDRAAGVAVDPLELPVKLPYLDAWRADFARIDVKKSDEGWRISGAPGAAAGARRVTLIRERPPARFPAGPVVDWIPVAADGSFLLVAGSAMDDRPYLALEYPWPKGCKRMSCNLDLIPLGLLLQKTAVPAAALPQSSPIVAATAPMTSSARKK